MKKYCLIFPLILLLLGNVVFATGEIKVVPATKEIPTKIGEIKSLSVTIQNNQVFEDAFTLTVFPQYIIGITAEFQEKTLKISPNSNKTTVLTFVVPEMLCISGINQIFTLYATSKTNSDISTSEKVTLEVPGRGLCISDVKLDKSVSILAPEEKTKIKIDVTNVNDKPFLQHVVQVSIKKDDLVLGRFDKTLNLLEKSKTEVEFDYSPEKYMEPGKYLIEVSLKDNLGSLTDSQIFYFNVNATNYPPVIKKSTLFGVLFTRITVTIKNENNVPLNSFLYVEDVPDFTKGYMIPITKTTSIETVNNRMLHSWLIETMKPGEERIVTYEFRMQNIVALSILIFIIILIAFHYVFSPKIFKKYKRVKTITGMEELEISIDVRNRTGSTMHDVIVTDFIPGMAVLSGRFGTLKPTVKEGSTGTEIVWRFERLGPFEERVLTYRIKPKVKIVGMMKLPNAHIRFLDKKMKRKIILSKSVLIE
jgi:hypothetical protein